MSLGPIMSGLDEVTEPSTRGRYRRRKKHHVLASILTKTGSARYSTTFRRVVAGRLMAKGAR